MVDFFRVLKSNESDLRIPEFLSSHPETESRIAVLTGWVEEHQACEIIPLELDWSALQSALKPESDQAEAGGTLSNED